MKTLLIYSSQTGNTKRLVDYLVTLDNDIEPVNASDEFDYSNYKNIIIGGWILMGTYDKKSLEVCKKLRNKNIGFFFTLTAYPTSSHAYSCATNIINLLKDNNNNIIDFFWSQGPLSKSYRESLLKRDKQDPYYPKEAKLKRWDIADKHPNEDDFEVAKTFYNQYIEKIKETL